MPRSSLISACVTLVTLLALAGWLLSSQDPPARVGVDERGGLVVDESYYAVFEQKVDVILRDLSPAYAGAEEAVDEAIRQHVEEAFAPVYAAIPAYADFHFSYAGQYAELASAAFPEQLTNHFQRMLIEETGLPGRLEASQQRIAGSYESAVTDVLGELRARLKTDLELTPTELRVVSDVAALSVEDAESRLAVTAGVTGAVVASLAVRELGERLLRRVVVRGGASMGTRAASAAAGGGGGLRVCPGHPYLRAACGAVGAVAGFFVVDAALIEADQLLFGEKFEAEVTRLIDEEKARIISELEDGYARRARAVRDANAQKLRGARVIDLIN